MPEVIPYNPLLTYKFRIYFTDDNNPIAGLSKMGALKQKTQNVAWRTGGHMWNSAAQIPGGAEYEPVAFEQGLGLDDGRLESWAMSVNNWQQGQSGRLPEAFRKDIRVDVLNGPGEVKLSYLLVGCWVSEWQVLPELDANNMSTIGISSFTVQLEGWRRA
jgi:phage tail-like protein